MRMRTTCISLIGVLLLVGSALAQSTDSGVSPDDSSADVEQGQPFQAPGVHVFIGQAPSKTELQEIFSRARSNAANQLSSQSDEPDFQNENVKIWVGRLPSREVMKNLMSARQGK